MSGAQEYPGMAGEARHSVPKCQACGYVGQWNVEALLLPHHIIIALVLMIFFGGGLIYLLIVVIARSNESGRSKICPNCGSKNMHTFLYADSQQAQYGAPAQQYVAAPQGMPPNSATVMAPAHEHSLEPAAILHLNDAPLATLTLAPGSRWTLGRSPGCQIVVGDSMVSGTHADLLVHSDRSLGIADRGSTNGTFVNGRRLDGEYRIQPGDVVLLGSETARLTVQMS